ncbi:MAG: hypothetical protein ACRDMV_24015 [Streptosporangiales bacterium]
MAALRLCGFLAVVGYADLSRGGRPRRTGRGGHVKRRIEEATSGATHTRSWEPSQQNLGVYWA